MLAEFTAITRARREKLPPRYYTIRRMRFIISPAPAGGWSVVPAGDGDGVFVPVPTVYRSGTTPPPTLIADTALYVLGLPKEDTADGRRAAAARHAGYVALIDAYAEASPRDPIAAQLAAFVHGPYAAPLAERVAELGGSSSDLVSFTIDGVPAHTTPAARAFWAAEVARRKSSGTTAVCCVCGQTAPALASLPEPIPAGAIPVTDSSGRPARGQPTQLVSINNAAQGRGGVMQLANTPICPDCGGDAVAGLTHLLGEQESRQRNRGSVLVWWSNDTVLDDASLLERLDQPRPETVRDLLDRLDRPGGSEFFVPSDARRFRAVTVAATKSRVVIRGQINISLDRLGGNLRAWFDDHRIDTGTDVGGAYVGLWLMAAATGRPAASGTGYLPDTQFRGVDDDLLNCALGRARLPVSLLPHLMHRITHDGVIDVPRVALLRLCLRRSPISSPEEATMIGLNEDAEQAAYQCGRLLRVLERIQQTAIPEINTTLADRNRAISRNPASLPNLVVNSRAHLKRLNGREKTRGAAHALERQLDAVLERINPFPGRFTLTEQGQFILGYHHQRAQDRRERNARSEAKRAAETGSAPGDGQQPDPAEPGES
jgi:CRISPR-associated protein Csd1